jgi:hypothetical protein
VCVFFGYQNLSKLSPEDDLSCKTKTRLSALHGHDATKHAFAVVCFYLFLKSRRFWTIFKISSEKFKDDFIVGEKKEFCTIVIFKVHCSSLRSQNICFRTMVVITMIRGQNIFLMTMINHGKKNRF